jgi:hypothetical protein
MSLVAKPLSWLLQRQQTRFSNKQTYSEPHYLLIATFLIVAISLRGGRLRCGILRRPPQIDVPPLTHQIGFLSTNTFPSCKILERHLLTYAKTSVRSTDRIPFLFTSL